MECRIRDIPVKYEQIGNGRPMVILHGSPLDHHSMVACLEPILASRHGWRRIYPDLPGHGLTSGPEWIVNNDQMLELLIEFIETLIPGQNFALVGESYGGYLARGIAHKLSSRIDGLLLWTPAKYPRSERKLPSPIVRAKDDQVGQALHSEQEKDLFSILVYQSREAMDFMRANVIPGWKLANTTFIERVVNTKFSFDLGSHQFEKPTLIISGRQDSVVGYQDVYEIVNDYPMSSMVIVDGAGHALGFTEGNNMFRLSVNEWIDRLENPRSKF